MLLLLVVGFVVWQVNDHFSTSKYYKEVEKSLMYIFLFAFIGGTIYKFSRIGKPVKLNGKFEGFLEFKSDSIVVDKTEYKIDVIEKVDITNNDFYGKGTGSSRGFDSNMSNGVDNHLTLILKNKQKVQCQFEMYNEFDMGKNDDILINYYFHGKLEFNQLLRILKVKGEKEIEDLKKFIPNATTTNSGFAL
jgi:hypothetical protein